MPDASGPLAITMPSGSVVLLLLPIQVLENQQKQKAMYVSEYRIYTAKERAEIGDLEWQNVWYRGYTRGLVSCKHL